MRYYGYGGSPFGITDRYVLGITLQANGSIDDCRVFSYPELTPRHHLEDFRGRPMPKPWAPVPELNESYIDEGL